MNERRVIVMGRPKSGKSWFLNQLLEKKVFSESNAESLVSRIETRTKAIKDNVNQLEYTLALSEVPGLGNRRETRVEGLENALAFMRSRSLNQIVLVFKMTLPLENELVNYLKTLAFLFKGRNMSDLVTLVINQITSSVRDEDIIKFQKQIKAILGLDAAKECICIRFDEKPRDCTFRYLVTMDGRFEFQDRNFLIVVGQTNAQEMNWLVTLPDPDGPDPDDSGENMFEKAKDFFFDYAPWVSTLGKIVFYTKILWGEVERHEFAIGLGLLLFDQFLVIHPHHTELQKLKKSLQTDQTDLREVRRFLRSPLV